jgi:hypothetical protein
MSFVNVFEHIFDCTNVVANLNVDVRIVFGRQIDIVLYHPTIVQFNAMNQNSAPHISALINRISVYIRHHLGLEFAWILLFAFAIFHAWGIWKRSSTWTMHHASGNCLEGQPVCLWIQKFSTNDAVYILDHVWLIVFSKEDENVCMQQHTLLKLNDIDSRNRASQNMLLVNVIDKLFQLDFEHSGYQI